MQPVAISVSIPPHAKRPRPRAHPRFVVANTDIAAIAVPPAFLLPALRYSPSTYSPTHVSLCSSSSSFVARISTSTSFRRRPSFVSRPCPPTAPSRSPCWTTISAAATSENLRENLTDVPDPVIRAVETLSRRQPRQTVADIAAAAGLSLSSVSDEVVKLASLTGAALDVSESGDIAYRFPSDVRGALRSRSVRAALSEVWRRVKPAVFTFARVGFGALLIISIVVTFVALAVLSAAGSRDDDRRDNRSSSMFFGPRIFFGPDIFDLMFYSRYSRNRRYMQQKEEGEMSFLEAVYSFVFGDGDPNADYDERRWRAVGAIIRSNRGAVTADQLAPLLDPPPSFRTKSSSVVDESFVLPALTRFQGRPEVTDDGDIIYVFPQLMTTASGIGVEVLGERSVAPALEAEEQLTRASPSQRALVVTLGVINVLGVLTLGAKMGSVIPMTRDAAQFIQMVRSIYPALAAYAASFVAAPVLRWLGIRRKNKDIKARNDARRESAYKLSRMNAIGGSEGEIMRRKILAAERYSVDTASKRMTKDNVVYSSDRDVLDQIKAQDDVKDDFDRRLNA